MMATEEQFCLRWNNHQNTLVSVFDALVNSGKFTDCSLFAEGKELKAHRVLLSACSPYFEGLLLAQGSNKYPVLIFTDVSYEEIYCILEYMYKGEVSVAQAKLNSFLKAAEALQVRGLTEKEESAQSSMKAPAPISMKPVLSVPKHVSSGHHRSQTNVKRPRPPVKQYVDSSFISSSSVVKEEVQDLTMDDDDDDRMTEAFPSPPDLRSMDESQDAARINNPMNPGRDHDTYDNLPDPPERDEPLANQNQTSPGGHTNAQGSHISEVPVRVIRRSPRNDVLKTLNQYRRSSRTHNKSNQGPQGSRKSPRQSSNIQEMKSKAHIMKLDKALQKALELDFLGPKEMRIGKGNL